MANTINETNNPDNCFQSIKLEDGIHFSNKLFNTLYKLQVNEMQSASILEQFLEKIQVSSVSYQEVIF